MRGAKLGEATYLLLPSRLQMAQLALPHSTPSTNPYTLPLVTTPPPKSVVGKHGRDSETSSETGDKGDEDGAAAGGTMGLRTDFDLPKQVSL